MCAGGFPESHARPPRRRRAWFDSYVTTTIERVVREISDIERAADLPRLLRLCAARSGQELNVTAIASDFGAPARIVDGYLARLGTAFLSHLLPAWSTNLSAKVVRRPKIVMVDSGLAAHLMTIHHFRDRDGPEVDLVLEAADGRVVGIEVKATSSVRSEDFRGLRYLADRLGYRFVFGAVLSTTPEALTFGPKLATLPVDVLWRTEAPVNPALPRSRG